MAKISISEASRLIGKPRSTIHRHLSQGKLSREKDGLGHSVIDLSELERVYGPLRQADMSETGASLHLATVGQDIVDRAALIELEAVKRENALLRDEREDLRRRLDTESEERRKLTAILTDQRKPEPPAPSPEQPKEGRLSRAWSILRGKV